MPRKTATVAYGDPRQSKSTNHNKTSTVVTTNTETSVSRIDDSDDHVLAVLHSESLQYKDVEALVTGLNPQRAQDILMSYRILSTLSQYLEETTSWTFCLLNNYDFQNNVRQFDLDVAIVVGKRAEHLLAEIYAWNIPRLKRMVTSMSSYYSDEATILTVIVFRIVSKYSDLEFTLQLALSRATLIKIHYEMAGLFSKLPGGSESSVGRNNSGTSSGNDELVESYRRFVMQLLEEIESTPFESVQQELFQVVRDLQSMFSKFSDSQMLESLEDSPMSNTFFDLHGSGSSSASTLSNSKLPPLAEEWQDDDFRTPGAASGKASQTHRRTFSNSTMFSSTTAASAKSTLSDDLPAVMQAFEVARKREEYNKQHSENQHTTPPDTPVRSSSGAMHQQQHSSFKSPTTSTVSSPSVLSSPTSSTSTNTRQQMWSSASSVAGSSIGGLGSAMVVKQQVEHPVPAEGAMQVKMVSNRMMILVDGKYIDMQDWAAKMNSSDRVHPGATTMSIPTLPVVAPGATPAPSYGLGSLFQPWLRPATKIDVPTVVSEDTNNADKQIVRKTRTKRIPKSQSIDDILSKSLSQQQQQQTQSKSESVSTLEMIRSTSMPLKGSTSNGFGTTNNTTSAGGFTNSKLLTSAAPSLNSGSNSTASSTSFQGTSAAAAMQSSSWIKNVIGKAEDQFGKNYNATMSF